MLGKINRLAVYLRNTQNLRSLGLVVVAGFATWGSLGALQHNYSLQKQIAELRQKVEIQKLENENLKLSSKYFDTNEYLELAARKRLGKAATGEKVILVPESVALKHSVEPPNNQIAQQKIVEAKQKPFYQQNLESWRDFLFN